MWCSCMELKLWFSKVNQNKLDFFKCRNKRLHYFALILNIYSGKHIHAAWFYEILCCSLNCPCCQKLCKLSYLIRLLGKQNVNYPDILLRNVLWFYGWHQAGTSCIPINFLWLMKLSVCLLCILLQISS